jgi:uncharacterized membrane protein YtjA (UPF0391 family)
MQRRFGFFFALAVVAAAIGFGRFTGAALATWTRVLFVVSLLLMFASVLFGRRSASS